MVSPHASLLPGNHLHRLERVAQIASPKPSRCQPFTPLYEAVADLHATGTDLSAVAELVCRLVAAHIGDAALVSVVSDVGTRLQPIAARHMNPRAQQLLCDMVLDRDVAGLPAIPVPFSDRIDVDLRTAGRLSGMLTAFRDAGSPRFTVQDRFQIHAFAERAAPIVEVARLQARLREKEERLSAVLDELFIAQESDRRRVAYDIHDGIAQIAASVYQHLEAFAGRHRLDATERMELERTQLIARRAVREARRVIAQLRPTVLDEFGLASALDEEIEGLQAMGMNITFENKAGDVPLPRSSAIALFRVAQEALANVRKHAGPATVRVELKVVDGRLRLQVKDTGRGFDAATRHTGTGPGERVGLTGIRERMALVGGTCTVWSRVGEGTRVTAELPLAGSEGGMPNADSFESAAKLQAGLGPGSR